MQRSYLDYAMSVIVGRALPDVRDGLKPVHRRVLYAMYDGGYRPDRGFSKSARVVGDVMGNYHPHGDSAIYDALVRLAQPWSLRYPLGRRPGQLRFAGQRGCGRAPLHRDEDGAAGHGDGPRHRRGHRRLQPNYDNKDTEPTVLPARFPNLLVNGSDGHRGRHGHQHPAAQPARGGRRRPVGPGAPRTRPREELLDALMERIKGPDFPTGAQIVGRARHRRRLPHRPRLDHHARRGRRRGGRPRPHLPGRSPSCRTRSTPTTSR